MGWPGRMHTSRKSRPELQECLYLLLVRKYLGRIYCRRKCRDYSFGLQDTIPASRYIDTACRNLLAGRLVGRSCIREAFMDTRLKRLTVCIVSVQRIDFLKIKHLMM